LAAIVSLLTTHFEFARPATATGVAGPQILLAVCPHVLQSIEVRLVHVQTNDIVRTRPRVCKTAKGTTTLCHRRKQDLGIRGSLRF
jgi:hypothetical protein